MKIKICTWKVCNDRFSEYVITRLKNDKQRFNLNKLEIEESMCMWKCDKWPNVQIDKEIINYVTPVKASELAFWKKTKKKKNNNKKEK